MREEVSKDGFSSVALDVAYGARFGKFDDLLYSTRSNPFDILAPSGIGLHGVYKYMFC